MTSLYLVTDATVNIRYCQYNHFHHPTINVITISYVPTEEEEASAFGDVARILQVLYFCLFCSPIPKSCKISKFE